MPGVHKWIKTDAAYGRAACQHSNRLFRINARRFFKSALSTLEKSLSDVNPPEDHPVRAYIRLAQMRTLRAWRCAEFPNRPKDLAKRKEWNGKWNKQYVIYRKKLAPLMEVNRGLRARIENMDKDFGYQPQK
jgi:hypothetical protein